jgi:acetyl esterase/lipase
VKRVVIAGHSFGGGVAVAAGLRSDTVSGIVSISPGRRIAERFMTPDGLAYVRERKTRDMKLAEPMPLELVKPMLETYDVARIRGTRLLKPLLMVEGSREPAADLASTRELLASCSGPVTHRVVADSEHYFGAQQVASTDGQRWHIAQTNLLDALASEIVTWLTESRTAKP